MVANVLRHTILSMSSVLCSDMNTGQTIHWEHTKSNNQTRGQSKRVNNQTKYLNKTS